MKTELFYLQKLLLRQGKITRMQVLNQVPARLLTDIFFCLQEEVHINFQTITLLPLKKIRPLMSDKEFALKGRSAVHIDELIQIFSRF